MSTHVSIGPGLMVDLAKPVLDKSHILALLSNCSKVNRFGGRGIGEVSVLRHSCLVEWIMERDRTPGYIHEEHGKGFGYVHDLHESPFGEIPTPAKIVIGQHEIARATGRFDQAIFDALGMEMTAQGLAALKRADTIALMLEKEHLQIDPDDDWGFKVDIQPCHRAALSVVMSESHLSLVRYAYLALTGEKAPEIVEEFAA